MAASLTKVLAGFLDSDAGTSRVVPFITPPAIRGSERLFNAKGHLWTAENDKFVQDDKDMVDAPGH